MQGPSYFRRQANTCMRLSESCTDQTLANRFQAMAEDFMARASEAETNDEGAMPFPHMLKPEGAGGGGIDRN
jgi:hypothetical protein